MKPNDKGETTMHRNQQRHLAETPRDISPGRRPMRERPWRRRTGHHPRSRPRAPPARALAGGRRSKRLKPQGHQRAASRSNRRRSYGTRRCTRPCLFRHSTPAPIQNPNPTAPLPFLYNGDRTFRWSKIPIIDTTNNVNVH